MAQILPAGTPAPNFTLRVTPDQNLSLAEFSGRRAVLAFYPADWSPVCGDQMTLYNHVRSEFQKHGAEILGISVDGAWCHKAFAEHRKLHFPLLSDFEPKGAVARQYGAYRDAEGVCERALFVIDRNGSIAWSYCSPIAVNPGADGILDALESLPK
jgi:peroxiredoxin